MMIEFVKTVAGRKFFERQLPDLTKAIKRVAKALEEREGSPLPKDPELVRTLAVMEESLAKMKAQGVTVDPEIVAKLRAELGQTGIGALDAPAQGLKHGEMWAPPGYKPLKLDESDITSAPQDAKRRALYIALDNWIQTSPDERALVVEHLRDQGEMPAQRAATILALFVQFEDALRDALFDEPLASAPKPEPA